MAHKKAGGSTRLGRDSISKRLGVKVYSGQNTQPGDIIIRQRGSRYIAGDNVRKGKDDTLYAIAGGTVRFVRRKLKSFTGGLRKRTIVSVQK